MGIPIRKGGDVPDLEPGTYTATCTAVKEDVLENPQFGDGAIVRIYMTLDDVVDLDGELVTLDAIANAKVSPKSKLTRWAEALGRAIDFDSETEFEPGDLLQCRALIKVPRKDYA